MTPHREPLKSEVGVRELHDRLSLAAEHALRGYDAVQLGCTLQLQGDDILVATWDNSLNTAAHATGRLIANDTD